MRPILLGHDGGGEPVSLSPSEREAHMHVIGASGSGKSKLLELLIRGDLASGQGFCLIDPHGSLYHDVLAFAAHKVVMRDIVLLNLSEPSHVIGFNPFRLAAKGDVSVQVDRRIKATMHSWGVENADQTPTLERTLRLVFTVLLELGLPFSQAEYLINFQSSEVRAQLVSRLNSPLIRSEWEELLALKPQEWRSEILSAKNRLFRLLTSKTLRHFLNDAANAIDLAEIIDGGKVLLVNLAPSDHLSEENGRVFGGLLVNEFFEVALRRSLASPKTLKPYFLYLDEFQTIVNPTLTAMLDQVRKFKLFTVLAHQRFGQLDDDLTDAVLTNCRIKAVFGGLPEEMARTMAKELFIRELDPLREKLTIRQTKFRPIYSRDRVYTRSTSRGSSSGFGENTVQGESSATAEGQFFGPESWNGSNIPSTSLSSVSGMSSVSGSHVNETDFTGETSGEADVPIFVPEPFEEVSSVQYFSLEEQLTLFTAALKEQESRNCCIKVQNRRATPLRVPLVQAHYTSQDSLAWYTERRLAAAGATSSSAVDVAMAEQERALLATFGAAQVSSHAAQRGRGKRAERAEPVSDAESFIGRE